MATVSLLPATAGTTAASDINDALYSSETNSMQVINGHLQAANLAGTLTSDHIREQSLADAKMVAATGNLDYTDLMMTRDLDDPGAAQPVPGASLEFYLPYDPSVVIITWNIGAGNTIIDTASENKELRLFVDDDKKIGHGRELPAGRYSGSQPAGDLYEELDFRYSGHRVITGMTKGFHSASLRLFVGTDMVRVRVRNMKVIWFR